MCRVPTIVVFVSIRLDILCCTCASAVHEARKVRGEHLQQQQNHNKTTQHFRQQAKSQNNKHNRANQVSKRQWGRAQGNKQRQTQTHNNRQVTKDIACDTQANIRIMHYAEQSHMHVAKRLKIKLVRYKAAPRICNELVLACFAVSVAFLLCLVAGCFQLFRSILCWSVRLCTVAFYWGCGGSWVVYLLAAVVCTLRSYVYGLVKQEAREVRGSTSEWKFTLCSCFLMLLVIVLCSLHLASCYVLGCFVLFFLILLVWCVSTVIRLAAVHCACASATRKTQEMRSER